MVSILITDDYSNTMFRVKMRRLEKIVQLLDSEELTYLVDYSITEMDRRYMEIDRKGSYERPQKKVSTKVIEKTGLFSRKDKV